jgi:hypothetical protein
MAKRVTERDENGKPVTYTLTRHQRKSEAELIGWTAGPQTTGQRIRRALWG